MSDTQLAMAMGAALIFAGLMVSLGGPDILGQDFPRPSNIQACQTTQSFSHIWDSQAEWQEGNTSSVTVTQTGLLVNDPNAFGNDWDSQVIDYPRNTPMMIYWNDLTIGTGGAINIEVYAGDQKPDNLMESYSIDNSSIDGSGPAYTASSFKLDSDNLSFRLFLYDDDSGNSPKIGYMNARSARPSDTSNSLWDSITNNIPGGEFLTWITCGWSLMGGIMALVFTDTGFAVLSAILLFFAMGFIIILIRIARGNG